jgi:phosphatidylserine/phosphatidylglycerophosphate/cardiolipin synthase-like enzyme
LRHLPLLLFLGLSACQPRQTQPSRPASLPQEKLIQVYTNHNPASTYTEPYRQQTRSGDDLEQIIVDTISAARSTVDVAAQELRLPKITAALIARQKTGVRVRVIVENTYSRPLSSFTPEEVASLPEREQGRYREARQLMDMDGDGKLSQPEIQQRDALVMLDRARVPRIDDTADGSAGSNLMHHKFVVVDGQNVIVTSANFTTSDIHGDFKTLASQGNANNLLKISSPELAALFTQEFAILWGDGPTGKPDSRFGVKKPVRPAQRIMVGSTPVAVQFSPTSATVPWSRSSNGLIGRTLSLATRSVDLALFVFSEQRLVNLLDTSHQKGVEVRALIDPGFAYRSYSEALDMLGITLVEDCKLEPDNRPWQTPIATAGVPRLPPGDLLHHKFGIVDQQTVITGSHNWTAAANLGNDETVLVVESSTVTAHFQREFDRLYSNAILGIPPAIQKKATAQERQCRHASGSQKLRQGTGANTSLPQFSNSVTSERSRELVNLNTASQTELESLPGVGPALAKRIIAARQKRPFASLADLDQLQGVGPRMLANLEHRITF